MGWTSYYQILRDRPFDDEELRLLVMRVAAHNRLPWDGEPFHLAVARAPRPDDVIAIGYQKLGRDLESTDLERLSAVLREIVDTFAGVELRVSDDHGLFGWDLEIREVTTDVPRVPLVAVDAGDEFIELTAVPPAAAPHDEALLDELLDCFAQQRPPTAETLAAAGLPAELASAHRYDLGRALQARLLEFGAARVGARLIRRIDELRDGPLSELAAAIVPPALVDPDVADDLLRAWDRAHGEPWPSPSRLDELLRAAADRPPILAAALEVLAAPDDRITSALEVLASATVHRRMVATALVARVSSDRLRPDRHVPWRGDVFRALAKIAEVEMAPTALLELTLPRVARHREALLEVFIRIGHRADVSTTLRAALSWPDLAAPAAKLLVRSAKLLRHDEREQLLAHAFWKIRLAAAEANPGYDEGHVERYAVWAAIEAAGLPMPADARRWARGEQDPPDATWAELAARHGTPIELPALPAPGDGADAGCADYRAWALWALDEAPPSDGLALRIAADELDRVMAAGGCPRTGARWSRWRAAGVEVPPTRAERLAWLRAAPRDGLSAGLALIASEGASGAREVAATLPSPLLELSEERERELKDAEYDVAARGHALLVDGLPPRLAVALGPSADDETSYF